MVTDADTCCLATTETLKMISIAAQERSTEGLKEVMKAISVRLNLSLLYVCDFEATIVTLIFWGHSIDAID